MLENEGLVVEDEALERDFQEIKKEHTTVQGRNHGSVKNPGIL